MLADRGRNPRHLRHTTIGCNRFVFFFLIVVELIRLLSTNTVSAPLRAADIAAYIPAPPAPTTKTSVTTSAVIVSVEFLYDRPLIQ